MAGTVTKAVCAGRFVAEHDSLTNTEDTKNAPKRDDVRSAGSGVGTPRPTRVHSRPDPLWFTHTLQRTPLTPPGSPDRCVAGQAEVVRHLRLNSHDVIRSTRARLRNGRRARSMRLPFA